MADKPKVTGEADGFNIPEFLKELESWAGQNKKELLFLMGVFLFFLAVIAYSASLHVVSWPNEP